MQSWITSAGNGLRRLLNEWDPIGVADEVRDEYDCLLAPLLRRLRDGAEQTEIGEFLRHELETHFALDPSLLGPEAMAGRIVAWWTAADPADGSQERVATTAYSSRGNHAHLRGRGVRAAIRPRRTGGTTGYGAAAADCRTAG
ncbi:hypothetical protein GCM10010420_27640 [Streptomyces glaucosporus]|uniref:Uncharacterized protein n=1 Tax=Streptomyces glaucosporus TaxID=284044 RepID=A0ABP5VHJ4_9ACTN